MAESTYLVRSKLIWKPKVWGPKQQMAYCVKNIYAFLYKKGARYFLVRAI